MSHTHALLVGVDRYAPERFSDGLPITSLQGCVRDVERMTAFLRAEPLALPEARIRTLVSPHVFTSGAEPAAEDLPTRSNLIREIRALGERSAPGDQLLIHYSGHGARIPTAVPEVKGAAGWDECLVPCDAGAAGLLRDVEIYVLSRELAERGLLVTWILDACHSGGAFRSNGTVVAGARTIGRVAAPPLPAVPVVLPTGLAELWSSRCGPVHRHVKPESGWFPQPEASALLAACRPHEIAREYAFDGAATSGALTHYLLEEIGASGDAPTLHELHKRLVTRIHTWCSWQTPMLDGDGHWIFLGGRRAPDEACLGVAVLEVESAAPARVRLAAGWLHGIRAGARFGIPGSEADAEVVEVGPAVSWARVPEAPATAVTVGTRLALEDPGPSAYRWRVAPVPVSGPGAALRVAEALRTLLPRRVPVWLEAVAAGDEADVQIGVDGQGSLLVLDGAGRALRHQGPPISAADPAAPHRLLHRLEHLARFHQVRELARLADTAPLGGHLRAELFRVPPGALPFDTAVRRPVDGPVPPEEPLHLVLTNTSALELNVAVLDLQADWGVTRVHPPPERGPWDSLDPESQAVVPLTTWLPPGFDLGRDLLLVFAATDPFDLSGLELVPLAGQDGALAASTVRPHPASGARGVKSTVDATGPWGVTSVELEVHAERGSPAGTRVAAGPVAPAAAGRWP